MLRTKKKRQQNRILYSCSINVVLQYGKFDKETACCLYGRENKDIPVYHAHHAGLHSVSYSCLTQEPEVLGSVPGHATYLYFAFR